MDNLRWIQSMFKGKKTYIVAVAIGVVVVAGQIGFIDANTSAVLLGLLGAGGLATLRMGVAGK